MTTGTKTKSRREPENSAKIRDKGTSPFLVPDAESLTAIEESLLGKGQKYTSEEFRKFLDEA